MLFLGVNIDHIATVRNARGGTEPDPVEAALIAESHGADGITAHLREDRRHIRDEDLFALKERIQTRLNMEMAATREMIGIALEVKPYLVTLVPERREELTTEGGLNVAGIKESLKQDIRILSGAGIRVSLFIEPLLEQIEAAHETGAHMVELHTGEYAHAASRGAAFASLPLKNLMDGARLCGDLGIEVSAGHGLTYQNVEPVLHLPGLRELNIGHSIVSRAIFTGIGPAVAEMKNILSRC